MNNTNSGFMHLLTYKLWFYALLCTLRLIIFCTLHSVLLSLPTLINSLHRFIYLIVIH